MWNLIRDEVFRPRKGVRPLDLQVIELGEDRITLGVTRDTQADSSTPGPRARDEWGRPGIWGLCWAEGYAQLGEILRVDEQQVVREFSPITGALKPGDRVRTELWPFSDDPYRAFGLSSRKVSFFSPLGEFSASLIEGSSKTWVIFVHGLPPRKNPIGSWASLLLITYRNDVGRTPQPGWFPLVRPDPGGCWASSHPETCK